MIISNKPQQVDIAIVGGGMVGASVATALSQTALRVALLEPTPPKALDIRPKEHFYQPKVSAITATSQQFLENLNAWPNDLASAYQGMYVWEQEGIGKMHFECSQTNHPCLGHIIENSHIQNALWQQLNQSNVQLIKHKILSLDTSNALSPTLHLDDQSAIGARLVIGADGANSLIRKQAGFAMQTWDYPHHALVCTVETEFPHQNTAWQCFLKSGPLAFLPLKSHNGQHYCSIVWSLVPEKADKLMQLCDEQFKKELGRAFEYKLGEILSVDTRYRTPLKQRRARCYYRNRVVLCGDAAHTIHPLAGQGANLGFMDAALLAGLILKALEKGEDFSAEKVLKTYNRARQKTNISMMALMEALARIYQPQPLVLKFFRNFGMSWLNQRQNLKEQMMIYAMGLIGELPDLAKKDFPLSMNKP